jgi:uncharacterized membrane protein YphA (DoxX/SURF4 family)
VFQVIENGEFLCKLDVLRPIPAIPIHISINNTIMEQIKLARPATALLKPIAYWIATGLIVLETAAGSEWDLARNDYVKQVFAHLGYPLYLLTILGIWKLPAAIVLVIPRSGRAKEWAYTGLFLVYTGAAASHFMRGDISEPWGPLVLALLTITSWALRPDSRKWTRAVDQTARSSRGRRVVYWTTTILTAISIAPGGAAQLFHARENVEGIVRLGYPVFFLTIIGFWKLLGGIVIVLPRFRLAKEWAYAGIVFDLSGAAASNAVNGMPVWHVVAPLVLMALALVSWKTQDARKSISTF